jgi:hypothetical protein
LSLQLEILSDYQLYFLIRSRHLTPDLKAIAEAEFKRRNISSNQLHHLEMEYDRVNRDAGPPLSTKEKILIILLPFFVEIQALLSTRHLYKNNTKRWKQHWRYVTIGFALWTVIVFLIAAFFSNRS